MQTLKIGDYIQVKRIWIYGPNSYAQGIILGIRDTKWDKEYKIISLLNEDGTRDEVPLKIDRDQKCLRIIAR